MTSATTKGQAGPREEEPGTHCPFCSGWWASRTFPPAFHSGHMVEVVQQGYPSPFLGREQTRNNPPLLAVTTATHCRENKLLPSCPQTPGGPPSSPQGLGQQD